MKRCNQLSGSDGLDTTQKSKQYQQSLLEKNTKLESSTKLQKYLKPLIPTLEKYSTRKYKKKTLPNPLLLLSEYEKCEAWIEF